MCYFTFLKRSESCGDLGSQTAEKSLPGQEPFVCKIDWKKVSAAALFVVGLLVASAAGVLGAGVFGAGAMYTLAGGLLIFSILPLSGAALLFFRNDST